ncbi:MAG: hypothetical protein GDA36_12900 [Rhodobacteraceae bacterium]|nr:hypothetical protein [Paracoccaceae bacterium]
MFDRELGRSRPPDHPGTAAVPVPAFNPAVRATIHTTGVIGHPKPDDPRIVRGDPSGGPELWKRRRRLANRVPPGTALLSLSRNALMCHPYQKTLMGRTTYTHVTRYSPVALRAQRRREIFARTDNAGPEEEIKAAILQCRCCMSRAAVSRAFEAHAGNRRPQRTFARLSLSIGLSSRA